MSSPDPLFDPENAYEDDDMAFYDEDNMTDDVNYNDYNDFHEEEEDVWNDSYDDSMDGDFDSAMRDAGHGTDEDYGYYGNDIDSYNDYYGEDY